MRWRRLEGDIDHWSSLTLVTLVTLVTGLCWRWWSWWHWSLVSGCIGEIGRWHWRSGGRRLMGRWFSMNGMFDNARSTIWCGKYNLMRRVQFTDESTYWTQYMYNCTLYMYTTLNGHIWLLHPFTSTPWVGRTFTGLMQASDEKYLRWIALIRNEKDLEKLEIVYFCHVM